MAWFDIWDNRIVLMSGFVLTLQVTVLAIVTSTILGFLVALLERANIPVVKQIVRVYLEVFRGSPLLIQMLFVFYGSAYLGLDIDAFTAAVFALTLYQASYISEIFRAGFESVPLGQVEAARSLGLSRFHVLKDVVLPQTLTVVLAPLFGQYIALVKYTALASVIGLGDLLRQGNSIISRVGHPFETYLVIGVLYFLISVVLSQFAKYFEIRSNRRMVSA